MKKLFFQPLIFIFICLFSTSCNNNNWNRHEGFALGTYYAITYSGEKNSQLKEEIDSILRKINQDFSIFDTLSQISLLNRNYTNQVSSSIAEIITLAQEISVQTEGAFDITIGPLIDLWGFGRGDTPSADSASIDSIRQFVGYNKISCNEGTLWKKDPRITLNFNAIAKGWAVDQIANYLLHRGYNNFVVDIGGEIVTHGNRNGEPWRIGIQIPTETADGPIESMETITLQNAAIATSGNYRNYHEINGERFSHILNPITGYPEKSSLLSVTVIAPTCAIADAYATAFMVMGKEKTTQFITSHPELKVCFVYDDHGTLKTLNKLQE